MENEFDALKKDFDENGFVIVQNLLDTATLENLRVGLKKITNNINSVSPNLAGKLFFEREHIKNNPQYYQGVVTAEECGDSVRQIEDLPLFDSAFADLIYYPRLLDVLENLFESPEFSFTMMLARPKAARVGNGIGNGNFHRDTPFEEFTEANTIVSILCLDEMAGENEGTQFVRGSHKISDEEARKETWRDVETAELSPAEIVMARCPAGSAIFFDTKVLHAAGHNRSPYPRRTIQIEWVGADVLPTSPVRYAFQGLKPRSQQPAFARQNK
ncbi:MAG: phytanoyl-CoA dioxygenase family protein [Acidobacteria bacterium]|jgi:ectoine hydroxylase-related dioxygenase (phytanoyl-CoA dioxygenase family)|nr:phytanoyl-CoA dioxygenase family protein [Acidobacteriota bacterium]